MPLLRVTGAKALHLCISCGAEREIKKDEWVSSSIDKSAFTAPPCPNCKSVESFSWHNWVYLDDSKPDASNVGAQQMVLIEEVAKALGRKRWSVPDRPKNRYPKPPKRPSAEEVRKALEP